MSTVTLTESNRSGIQIQVAWLNSPCSQFLSYSLGQWMTLNKSKTP